YRQTAREIAWSIVGYAAATLTAFSVLLLEPNLGHAIHEFWARTFAYQVSRESPFSIWDWRQYHARGLPDLHILQRVVQVLVVLPGPEDAATAPAPPGRAPRRLGADADVLDLRLHRLVRALRRVCRACAARRARARRSAGLR